MRLYEPIKEPANWPAIIYLTLGMVMALFLYFQGYYILDFHSKIFRNEMT